MIPIVLSKIYFSPGDNFEFEIDLLNTSYDLSSVEWITISIAKVDIQRNEDEFGFSTAVILKNGKLLVKRELKNELKNGIYFIASLSWKIENQRKAMRSNREIALKYFQVGDDGQKNITESEIEKQVEEIYSKRIEYRNHPFTTKKGQLTSTKLEYKVLVFCSGCLLHSVQELKGITIFPLPKNLNYSHFKEPVIDFLKKRFGLALQSDASTPDEFRNSNPLFCIEFFNVIAQDNEDAIDFCREEAETLFSILGYKRGQRPSVFAYTVIDIKKGAIGIAFNRPRYRGNISSDFSRTILAKNIDRIQNSIIKNPAIKFLIDDYASAQNESSPDIKCARLWVILEFISAKINIDFLLDSESRPLKNEKQEILRSDSTLGKVYKLIYDSKLLNHTFANGNTSETITFEFHTKFSNPNNYKVITLWEFVSAVYLIRNKVAHTGRFDLKKYINRSGEYIIPVRYFDQCLDVLNSIVHRIIEIEIKK